ncbi:uncharacterized protein LOC131333728 isoform X2 [Rhododendron vialii]|uniref:uncharacterized protein LOC131333728 isoform X2 n=1 Tax=Rhododendron vialii TaxID=182163 RepID=UPI00265F34BA|nr:uncharacterized protein LOC131333728 isoform X2 [Rhododendron vialii]XP_058224420.1 uncharacterized protein LOC131333728 isoform X2 [Rhododendron vialii]
MPQNHLRPLKRAMAIEEAEISSGKFMEKASVEVEHIPECLNHLQQGQATGIVFLCADNISRTKRFLQFCKPAHFCRNSIWWETLLDLDPTLTRLEKANITI